MDCCIRTGRGGLNVMEDLFKQPRGTVTITLSTENVEVGLVNIIRRCPGSWVLVVVIDVMGVESCIVPAFRAGIARMSSIGLYVLATNRFATAVSEPPDIQNL